MTNARGRAHVFAVAVFAACGVYQLSGPKDRCLTHCRTPLPLARAARWGGDLGTAPGLHATPPMTMG